MGFFPKAITRSPSSTSVDGFPTSSRSSFLNGVRMRLPSVPRGTEGSPWRTRHLRSVTNWLPMRAPRIALDSDTLTIRRTSGHHIVALLEIVSPGNKDRVSSVQDFVKKVESVLIRGIHVLIADLFPPGKHDPRGMHGEIWSRYASEPYNLPADQPLTLSSYLADDEVEAYVEHMAFGEPLPAMPLFLDDETYIYVPLETTYQAAFADLPDFWRDVLEGKQPAH